MMNEKSNVYERKKRIENQMKRRSLKAILKRIKTIKKNTKRKGVMLRGLEKQKIKHLIERVKKVRQ